jgi:hypothetical protein
MAGLNDFVVEMLGATTENVTKFGTRNVRHKTSKFNRVYVPETPAFLRDISLLGILDAVSRSEPSSSGEDPKPRFSSPIQRFRNYLAGVDLGHY